MILEHMFECKDSIAPHAHYEPTGLTGMPGYRQSLSELQLWQVSLYLSNRDKLPT